MPTLIDRLRAGADNIHSIGPARAADLLREAADALVVPPSGRRPTRPSGSLDELNHQDAVAAHIKAHGGDPASATVAQIADAMNAVDPNATYKPNAEGNGLDWSPVQLAGVGGSIRIVDGDPKTIAALGLERGCHEHCLSEPRCRNRAEMRAAHGTPAEYIAAISRAAPELSVAEADLAVVRYCEAWNAAPEPNAALQRALNSILTAMGCDPASATRAEFKQALWAAASAGACIGCEGEQFEGAICERFFPQHVEDSGLTLREYVDMEMHWHSLNERRLDLIDLEISHSITGSEADELDRLQLIADVKFRPLHQEAMRRLELADNGDGTFRRVYHSPEEIAAMRVADELEVDRADEEAALDDFADPDLSTPIGAPSLAVAEQFDAEARAASEDPGTPGDAFELSEGLDDSDRE